jgi:hypothetical protein
LWQRFTNSHTMYVVQVSQRENELGTTEAMKSLDMAQTRRTLIKTGLIAAGGAVVTACAQRSVPIAARPMPLPVAPLRPEGVEMAAAQIQASPAASHRPAPTGVRPDLFRQAIASLNRHSMRIASHDRIAIADFATPSHRPRFHIVNLGSGEVQSYLVAHGVGSDPEHTGLLHSFSNAVNSEATSEGAFLTSDYYVGKHGRSQRLMGLDPTNCNALGRAIVVHSAWYANPDMIRTHGVLGRSQGCFAVGDDDLDRVFANLGPGRMIYSAKV